jgi:hypothetical protein
MRGKGSEEGEIFYIFLGSPAFLNGRREDLIFLSFLSARFLRFKNSRIKTQPSLNFDFKLLMNDGV